MTFKHFLLTLLLAVTGALSAHADLTVRGKAVAIVDGKECPEAALVCVTSSAAEAVVWHESPFTSAGSTIVGAGVTEKHPFTLFFHVQPREGYRLLGWSASKTGSNIITTDATYEWTGNNGMQTVTTKTYYAILESTTDEGEPADLGDGAAFHSVLSGGSYTIGKTGKDWAVRIGFSKPLAYDSYLGYSEGYGVDRSLTRYVTCSGSDGKTVHVTSVRVTGAYDAGGADASGLIMLSSDVTPGTYTLHLPYGLFLTADGGVTAACDVTIEAVRDSQPFSLVSISPENGSTWDCDMTSETANGTDINILVKFNRVIASLGSSLGVSLKAGYGATYVPTHMAISAAADKTIGIISFGRLPNSSYTLSVPAGTFYDSAGEATPPFELKFTVTGSAVSQWALPTYSHYQATPAPGSTVRGLREVTIDLSREGFDAPVNIMPGMGVQAFFLREVYPSGADPNDPEVLPQIVTEEIDGVTPAIADGRLVVRFSRPVNQHSRVLISIPQGLTNNLYLPIATLSSREIFEEGGCTNPAIQLTYTVVPGDVEVTDVTGIGYDTHFLTDDEGNFVRDADGQYIRVDHYDSLIGATLTPPSPDGDGTDGDRVTVIYFWYGEEFATLNYTGGASVTNLTTGSPVAISTVGFKQGGDSHRRDVIALRLSGDAYLQSATYHQGLYEVVLPAGIATTADGLRSGGITFRFTYGDPEQAYVPHDIDLDAYVGDYRAVHEEGEEVDFVETFSVVRHGSGYAVTGLCGSPLVIPFEAEGEHCYLRFTEDSDGWAFMSPRGSDVAAMLQMNDNRPYIYIDEYALFPPEADPIIGGVTLYERCVLTPEAIPCLSTPTGHSHIYDLYGRLLSAPGSRIVIASGKKMIK